MISEVYNIDNMDFMSTCKDKQFSLAIVDPPYFEGPNKNGFYNGGNSKKRIDYLNIKSWTIPDKKYYLELCRISVNQIIWGINYFPKFNNLSGPGRIIWDKKNESSSFSDCEIASNSLTKSVKIYRYQWNGFLQENMSKKETKIHPTQKPVQLYKWLLKNYAKPGDKILDTHLGSQSSRIACYEGGFDFWGCELDKDYFDSGCKRFENYKLQLKLFLV